VRLFVAFDLPDVVRQAFRELIVRLKPACRGAKWVRPEAMHVTLKFIGEVAADKLAPIRAALAPIHSAGSVELNFGGLGFFPNERRPRVLWCGVAASPNLAELAGAIDRALVPLGITAELRDFVPHLTLARFNPERGARADLDALVRAAGELKSYDFGRTRETEFHLIESMLKPAGAEYKRVETFSILKGSA
jgi:RNA 2',3'-cyclic 3'-phosphodiesterase